jgi:phosphoribosylanthranilate isomerase
MTTWVKICGLTDAASVDAALDAGADAVGFVVEPTSPRYVTPADAARLAAPARGRALVVALLVSPDAARVAEAVDALAPDALQVYGPPLAAGARPPCALWRAVSVRTRSDLPDAEAAVDADRLVLDTPPPAGAQRSGGGWGTNFDWTLLAGWTAPKPWILSGGLTPANVADAVARTGATAVDVSSGVETAPGVKDPTKIAAFIAAAKEREAA